MRYLAVSVRVTLLVGAVLLKLTDIAAAQSPLLEVEDANATTLMRVGDDAGLLVGGRLDEGAVPASGAGVRLMWYPGKAALRAGQVDGPQWDDANVGTGSIALGLNNSASNGPGIALGINSNASGDGAVAIGASTTSSAIVSVSIGRETQASGNASTALGFGTKATATAALAAGSTSTASGHSAIAMGGTTTASGPASFAVGRNSIASGNVSTALGAETIASGQFATALGQRAEARGEGSFAFGDASTTGMVVAVSPNQFVARAAGGFRFLTNPTLTTGCDLDNGNFICTGTVSGSSSVALKHDFQPMDPESVLQRVTGLSVESWRYRADTAEVRHVGPTAEDFHGAFALGANDRTIAMVDADGINLLAVQALARRTDELQQENIDLRSEVKGLRQELDTLLSLIGSGR